MALTERKNVSNIEALRVPPHSIEAEQAVLGTIIGVLGGRAIVAVLNRLGLAQGLHAPFVTTSALVTFGLASALHA